MYSVFIVDITASGDMPGTIGYLNLNMDVTADDGTNC